MTSLASVFVEGRIDTSRFGTDIRSGMSSSSVTSSVRESGTKAGTHFKSGFGAALRGIAAPLVAVLGTAAVGSFLKGTIDEAREAQKVGAQTATVLKSTGGIAGVTAKQIGDLANAISAKSGIDDEAIQSGANLLLTFKNIHNEAGKGNDVFSQATQAITDLSVGMGQSLKSSAVQVGKALNDPIKGVTALSRVGVTFTDQQKKQIKALVDSGNTMKAQKIILKELGSEFGGSAAAQATAGEKAKVAFDNLKESIGTALIPILDKLETVFVENIVPALYDFAGFVQSNVLPMLSDFAGYIEDTASTIRDQYGAQIVGVLETLWEKFRDLLDIGREILDWMNENRTVVLTFVGVIGVLAAGIGAVTLATTLWTAALALNPIGIVVVALAALAAGLVYAYQNSEKFREIVDETWSIVKTVVADGIGFVTALWATFGDTIVGYVKASFGNIAQIIRGVFQVVSGIFDFYKALFTGDWQGTWDAIKQVASGMQAILGGLVKQIWEQIKLPFSLGVDAIKRIWTDLWDSLRSLASHLFGGVVQIFRGFVADIVDLFFGMASKILDAADFAFGWIPGISDLLDGAKAKFAGFRDSVNAYLRGIEDQHVTVTGSFSAPSQAQINKVTAQLGGLPSASGRLVTGGITGMDSVNILAMPGEFVTRKSAVDYYGHDFMHAINTLSIPKFSVGGLVPQAQTDASGAAATAAFDNRAVSRVASLVAGGLSSALDKLIAGMASRVSGIMGGGSGQSLGNGLFRPANGPITQGLHDQWTGFPALDIGVPVGTPVHAGASGKVIVSRDIFGDQVGGYASYGRYMEVLSNGFTTLYAHLSQRGFGVGSAVRGGQTIGLSGDTGNTFGAHLHFGAAGISPYAFYDRGGPLYPGLTMAFNGTGKTETVTTADDMRDVIAELRALRSMLDEKGVDVRNPLEVATGVRHVARNEVDQDSAHLKVLRDMA